MKDRKGKKGGPINALNDFIKITAAIPVGLWMRTKKYYPFGKEKLKGGVLISANHRSMLDPVILLSTFPFRRLHSLATKELFKSRFSEFLFKRGFLCVPVDKDNFSMDTFRQVVERLSDGKAVFIFPEGRLNNDDDKPLLSFKSGAILMAYRSGAPILPVYIVKRKRLIERQRVVIGKPVDIKAIVGPSPTMTEMNKASEYLRERELELREYYENNILKKRKEEKISAEKG